MFKLSNFIVSLGCAGVLGLASSAMAQTCNSSILTENPNGIYQVNNDGTVTDIRTELIWQKCSLGQSDANCSGGSAQTYTWAGALQAAQQANSNDGLLGHKDWRLPSIAELGTLAEKSCSDPAINASTFPNTQPAKYWSASPLSAGDGHAWHVNFSYGSDGYDLKDDGAYVRLVRGGQ